jgi:hypothetical protein
LLCLLLWHLSLSISDLVDEVVWVLAVNGATDTVASAQELSADAGEVLGHRSLSHGSGGSQNIVPGDVTVVLDVLDLLSVTWWLLEGLDDQGRGAWHNGDLSLSVLDGQFDSNFQAFPLLGVLADVVTDLLWGETEWADLWRQGGGWGDLTSDGSELDDHDSGWVKFWWHVDCFFCLHYFCKFDLSLFKSSTNDLSLKIFEIDISI